MNTLKKILVIICKFIICPLFILFILLSLWVFYAFYPWSWYVKECVNYTHDDVINEMNYVFGNKKSYKGAKVKAYKINPNNGAIHALIENTEGGEPHGLIVPCSMWRLIDYIPYDGIPEIEE